VFVQSVFIDCPIGTALQMTACLFILGRGHPVLFKV